MLRKNSVILNISVDFCCIFVVFSYVDRLVKIVDYNEGTFQDFVAHSDAVRVVKFSPHANMLFSAGYTDVVVWTLSSI